MSLASLSSNNVISSMVTHATIDTRFYGIRNSTDMTSVFWNSLECRRVYLATDSFWLEDWVRIGKKREKHVSLYHGRWRHSTVGDGKWQVNDGLYAEVLLWCASGPIAWRWIVPTCVWKLSDCKNGSVGRLPQEVLLEEFYRSESSETVQVGRVRVFEEFLTV
jgi:hypothetical protein